METIIINIDSRKRNKNDYPEDFNFRHSLQNPLNDIVSINLNSIEFTNSDHLITAKKKNNIFTVILENENIYDFKLDDGNYLPTKVSELFNEFSEINFLDISLIINKNTGKAHFESTYNAFSITFNASVINYLSLGEMLGFENGSKTSVLDGENNIIKATNIINFIGENYYFLKINNIGNIYNNSNKYFAKLIIENGFYQIIFEGQHKNISKIIEFNKPIDLHYIDICIEDNFGNEVKSNGIPLSLTLEFKILRNSLLKDYKKNNFYTSELKKIILYDKMLAYYNEKSSNNSSGLATVYHKIFKNKV